MSLLLLFAGTGRYGVTIKASPPMEVVGAVLQRTTSQAEVGAKQIRSALTPLEIANAIHVDSVWRGEILQSLKIQDSAEIEVLLVSKTNGEFNFENYRPPGPHLIDGIIVVLRGRAVVAITTVPETI